MSSVHEAPTLVPEDSATEVQFSGRRAILVILLLCLCVAVVRLLCIDGWLRTITIDGPSMAPSWKNEHFNLTCADCNYFWPVDASVGIPSAGWWCPNCGTLQSNPLRQESPAEQVFVDRWPLFWGEPNRWEVVALLAPGEINAEQVQTIKRVIGLPGEEVSIRAGDIFIDDQRPPRRLTQWRQTAIVVHDDMKRRTTSDSTALSRWNSLETNSGWRVIENGYQFAPPADDEEADKDAVKLMGLAYVHQRQRRGAQQEPAEVLDDDHYNQDSRELESAADVAISCWIHVVPGTNLELRVHDGTNYCRAHYTAEKQEWTLYYGDQQLTTAPYHWNPHIPVHTEWIRVDGELLLVMNGRTVAKALIDGVEASIVANLHHDIARISAAGGEVTLKALQILRDIHYLPPTPSSVGQPTSSWQLGPDEYFVLGDNAPVSVDSRHWPAGSILRDNIWGVIRR